MGVAGLNISIINERGVHMGLQAGIVMLAVFLGFSWIVRYIISKDTTDRVDRKVAEQKAGFCTWPREAIEE